MYLSFLRRDIRRPMGQLVIDSVMLGAPVALLPLSCGDSDQAVSAKSRESGLVSRCDSD